jgi:hypothetical protein
MGSVISVTSRLSTGFCAAPARAAVSAAAPEARARDVRAHQHVLADDPQRPHDAADGEEASGPATRRSKARSEREGAHAPILVAQPLRDGLEAAKLANARVREN